MDISPKKKNRGFTLAGVMVAIFVLVSGILAVTQLMARTEHTSVLSKNNFIATNLSREGLELVQVMRDNNWFNKDAESWTENICDESLEERIVTVDRDNDGAYVVQENPNAEHQKIYLDKDGRFTHKGIEETLFSRFVTIDCSQRENDPAYIDVTSTVTWPEGKEVSLKTKLYDWYRSDFGGSTDGNQYTFNNAWAIRGFINGFEEYSSVPEGRYAGALRDDPDTLQKICELVEYPSVVSSTQRSWRSCDNNYIAWWDEDSNDFKSVYGRQDCPDCACSNNHFIDQLVCEK